MNSLHLVTGEDVIRAILHVRMALGRSLVRFNQWGLKPSTSWGSEEAQEEIYASESLIVSTEPGGRGCQFDPI